MVKVFLSQPMSGRTEEAILAERERMIKAIKKRYDEEVEILDTYFEDYNPQTGSVPLKYLAKSIEMLADADIAFFADGWEKMRGCQIERACAEKYGITIMDFE